MPLIPLLPIFHRLSTKHFNGALVKQSKPIINVRWSDGRLRKTAGFYRRKHFSDGRQNCEIVLSQPLLGPLPQSAIESTLCHEMIHAWIDLILKINEGHGPHFRARMAAINATEKNFQVSVCHKFPVPSTKHKWIAICPSCGMQSPYLRRVPTAACKYCCNKHHGGKWNPRFLLTFQAINHET